MQVALRPGTERRPAAGAQPARHRGRAVAPQAAVHVLDSVASRIRNPTLRLAVKVRAAGGRARCPHALRCLVQWCAAGRHQSWTEGRRCGGQADGRAGAGGLLGRRDCRRAGADAVRGPLEDLGGAHQPAGCGAPVASPAAGSIPSSEAMELIQAWRSSAWCDVLSCGLALISSAAADVPRGRGRHWRQESASMTRACSSGSVKLSTRASRPQARLQAASSAQSLSLGYCTSSTHWSAWCTTYI